VADLLTSIAPKGQADTMEGVLEYFVFQSEDGVYCVDPRDGRLVWRYAGVHVDMSPSVTEGGVFFGSVYGSPAFYALDPRSGALRWKRAAPLGVSGSPSTDGERICFGLGNGTFEASHAQPRGAVVCLAADGRTLWQRDLPDAVLTTVALADGAAYFGCRDGRVYGVDAATGEVRWSFATQDAVVSSPAVAGGRVYFGSNDGTIYGVEARTGAKIWSYDTSQEAFNTDARVMASPAISDGRLYVGSMNFCFFALGDGP
jgi:outer membrane protein assembly factor BamB